VTLEEKKYDGKSQCIASTSLIETFGKSAAKDADSHYRAAMIGPAFENPRHADADADLR
jgi:hypothetical protein